VSEFFEYEQNNEALRLIQHMDEEYPEDWDGSAIRDELRRLHEAHDWQYKMAGERLRRVEKLEAERDAATLAERKAILDILWDYAGRKDLSDDDQSLLKHLNLLICASSKP
jgi:hypothetical protein